MSGQKLLEAAQNCTWSGGGEPQKNTWKEHPTHPKKTYP